MNVANFGARDDAQDTQELGLPGGRRCMVPTTSTVDCGSPAVFVPTDVGKSIEIPAAGSGGATFVGTICGAAGTGGSTATGVVLCTPANTVPINNVYITWGTLNDAAFNNAAVMGCPLNAPSILAPFTSRGCVIIVPVGPNGTGSYMFGTGVTMSAQTSIQIIGAGNSARQEQSTQAGVRLITAADITILTIGNPSNASQLDNDYGAFQLSNITFRDTSGQAAFPSSTSTANVAPGSGAALGGVRMINVSEAIISYCSFEDFNGARPGQPAGDTLLSYGMLSDPNISSSNTGVVSTGFNNNIMLIHDKGRNNSVFYDSSLPGQDGPIVIGGDIFPENTVSTGTNPTTSTFSGVCYGFINAGPIRMFGTHLDVRLDDGDGMHHSSQLPCVGILMEGGGLVHTKIESSVGSAGTGVYLNGGNVGVAPTSSSNISSITSTGAPFVTVVVTPASPSPPYVAGETVMITGASMFNGLFKLATVSGSTLTFALPGAPVATLGAGGTLTGFPTIKADLDLLLTNTGANNGVYIGNGATSNIINIVSSGDAGSAYTDNNAPGGPDGNLIEVADAGLGAEVNWLGGTAISVPTGPGNTGGFLSLAATGGGTTLASATGGTGGFVHLFAGPGGNTSGGTNGTGGSITIQSGAAGSGGTGGSAGTVTLTSGGTLGVQLSPSGVLAGTGGGSITADTVPAGGISGTVSLTTQVSGTLPIGNGGTGAGGTVSPHNYFGNNTGSSATPGFVQPVITDITNVTTNGTASFQYQGNSAVAAVNGDFLPVVGSIVQNGTESLVATYMARAGTGVSLFVHTNMPVGFGITVTVTLNVNGSGTGSLTCPITGTVSQSCSDSGHTPTWSAGSFLDYKFTVTGGTPAMAVYSISLAYY